jgi:hypothetical protein
MHGSPTPMATASPCRRWPGEPATPSEPTCLRQAAHAVGTPTTPSHR